MHHRDAQFDVSEMSRTQTLDLSARYAGGRRPALSVVLAATARGAEERIVQSARQRTSERVVGHARRYFAHRALTDVGVGVYPERDGRGRMTEDGLIQIGRVDE